MGLIQTHSCQIPLITHIMPWPENVAFYGHEKSANKEIKGSSNWPDLPYCFNLINMHGDQQLHIENLCDVKDIEPNHH